MSRTLRVAKLAGAVLLLALVFREVHVGVNFHTLGWSSRPPIVRWCGGHYHRSTSLVPAAQVDTRRLHKVQTSPSYGDVRAAPKTGGVCPAAVYVEQADGNYLRYPLTPPR